MMAETGGGRLLWADEFLAAAGTPPDARWWSFETGDHGWGNGEQQRYTDERANAAHDGEGNLVIRAIREKGGYTSARLVTKHNVEFCYGRLESRMLLPKGAGVWPALWLLGSNIDGAPWPACGEIDVMENVGAEPRRVFGTVHCPGFSGSDGISGGHCAAADLGDDYRVFAVDWTPERIGWSLDGREYFAVTARDLGAAWVFDHPFYILLNLAVGGWLGGAVGSDTRFPAELKVDFIRIYESSD
jgi:beta-glucanase (GH16 family)